MAAGVTVRKIYVAGGYAAGKSTFARKVATCTGLPLHHMDSFIWRAGWVQSPDTDVEAAVRNVLKNDRWIIEGWIQVEDALQQADIVIYLDPSRWRLAWQALIRSVQGQFAIRPELPIGCKDDFDIKRLWRLLTEKDHELIKQLAKVPPEKLVHLTSHRIQEKYLESLA